MNSLYTQFYCRQPKPMILPQLTTVTPSLQKKYDRLPKATEVFPAWVF